MNTTLDSYIKISDRIREYNNPSRINISYYDTLQLTDKYTFELCDEKYIDMIETFLEKPRDYHPHVCKEVLMYEKLFCSVCDCNKKTIDLHFNRLICNSCVFLTHELMKCHCHVCCLTLNDLYIIRVNDKSLMQKFPRHKCNQCNLMLKKTYFSSTQLHTKKMYRRCIKCVSKSCKTFSGIEKKRSYLTLKRTTDFKNYYNLLKKYSPHHSMLMYDNYSKFIVFQYLEIKMLRHRVMRKKFTISSLNLYMYDSVNQIVLSYVC
jgi:hypothetical protein